MEDRVHLPGKCRRSARVAALRLPDGASRASAHGLGAQESASGILKIDADLESPPQNLAPECISKFSRPECAVQLQRAISAVFDENFIGPDGAFLFDFANLFKSAQRTPDAVTRDNALAASIRVGQHCFAEHDMSLAAEFFCIALSLGEDEALCAWLLRKGVLPPYTLRQIVEGLHRS